MPPLTTTGSETSKADAPDRGLGSATTITCRRIRFLTSIRYYKKNWGSIRTHTSHGPVQSRYNFNLMTSDTVGLELGHIFTDQTTAFKLNIMASFFEVEHRVDTDIIIAPVTAVVDTSTNLA